MCVVFVFSTIFDSYWRIMDINRKYDIHKELTLADDYLFFSRTSPNRRKMEFR
jgi:hypothetical protein